MARLAGDADRDRTVTGFFFILLGLIQGMGRGLTGPLWLMSMKEKGPRDQHTADKHRQYDIGNQSTEFSLFEDGHGSTFPALETSISHPNLLPTRKFLFQNRLCGCRGFAAVEHLPKSIPTMVRRYPLGCSVVSSGAKFRSHGNIVADRLFGAGSRCWRNR